MSEFMVSIGRPSRNYQRISTLIAEGSGPNAEQAAENARAALVLKARLLKHCVMVCDFRLAPPVLNGSSYTILAYGSATRQYDDLHGRFM